MLSPKISPQAKLRISKSDLTRSAILNAAMDFVWSQPFREMTVTSLMAETSASRATFYQYFKDLHELMETLLEMLQSEIFEASNNWIAGVGDPLVLLHYTFTSLVQVCYERGPFLRAISDASTTDPRFEAAWKQFLETFDNATTERVKADQAQGLIADFDVHPVSTALTRLNAYTLIQAFGQHPRSQTEPVRDALVRVWVSTLYGSEWVGKKSSTLLRKGKKEGIE